MEQRSKGLSLVNSGQGQVKSRLQAAYKAVMYTSIGEILYLTGPSVSVPMQVDGFVLKRVEGA